MSETGRLRTQIEKLRAELGLGTLGRPELTRNELEHVLDVLEKQVEIYQYWQRRIETPDGRDEALFCLQYFTSIPLPVWAARRDSLICHWNEYAQRTYGHSAGHAMGKSYLSLFISEQDKAQSQQDLLDIIDGVEGREHFNMADDFDKDKRLVHVLTCCFPVFDLRSSEVVQAEISFDTSRMEDYRTELDELRESYKLRMRHEKDYLINTVNSYCGALSVDYEKKIARAQEFVHDPNSRANERTTHSANIKEHRRKKVELDRWQAEMIRKIPLCTTERSLHEIRVEIDKWKETNV